LKSKFFQWEIIMKKFTIFWGGIILFAGMVLLAGFAGGGASITGGNVVLQLDMRNSTVNATNIILTAFNGVKLYGNRNEWQVDPTNKTLFNAVGSGALPLRVEASPETSGKYVKTLFIVTTNAPAIRLFETVVASNERWRIGGKEAGNDLFNDEAIPDTGRFTVATWSVDLAPEANLLGGQKQLLEIIFHEPQKLEDMHFLSEGRAEWLRAYRGGILECIAFSGPDPVSEPVKMAIAHYFRLKYGLSHLTVQSTPHGRAAGSAMGVNYCGYFGTIYTIR
jgi:hypothetical protein